jgi:hypothetical protein
MQQFKKNSIYTAIFTTLLSTSTFAADYYIDAGALGSDTNNGTSLSTPFKTLDHALSSVNSSAGAGAGDIFHLRAGTYKTAVKRNDIQGASGNPVIIQAYVNGGSVEEVTFDGRDAVTGTWIETSSGSNIWTNTVTTPTWQLFRDDELLVNARWPNANFDDNSMYSRDSWALAEDVRADTSTTVHDPASHNGVTHTLPGFSLVDAMIIANSRNFMTYTRHITGHSSNTLTHEALPFATDGHNYYYLEGLIGFLDVENEWFIDSANLVSIWSTTEPLNITGRTRAFAIDGKGWEYVEFKNLNFTASSLDLKESESITLTNCDFTYSAVGKRALGYAEAKIKASVVRLKNEVGAGNFKVINSSFSHSEAQALYIKGNNTVVDNSLFSYVDWTSTETYMPSASIVFNGTNTTFKYNTVHHAGTSEAIATDGNIKAEYNHIYETGYAQSDGAMLQIRVPSQLGSVVHHNWLHDAEKYGYRFDAPVPATAWGTDGFSHHNVVWNTGGIMAKSVHARHFSNVAMGNSNIDMIILAEDSVPTSGTAVPSNDTTLTTNNVADTLSGHRKNETTIPGTATSNHNASGSVKNLFADADNYDFRPTSALLIDQGTVITDGDYTHPANLAPDIGAYESGNAHYWIPGRKEALASHPIPLDTNMALKGTALMWREALNATQYEVFMGTSSGSLSSQGTYTGNNNIHQPSAPLAVGTHYWRIDTTVNGVVETGEEWEFTVYTPPVIVELFNDDMEDGDITDWTVDNLAPVINNAANSGSLFGSRIKGMSSIEKAIDTSGHTDITVSYDRRTRNFDAGESLIAEWFDGTTWQELENTTDTSWVTSSFSLPSTASDNANVKIRFITNSSANNENADIDNVIIKGTVITATSIYSDGFESGLTWTKGGTDKKVSVIANAANSGSYGVRVKQNSYITKVIDTTGYSTITVKYDRRTVGLDAGEDLVVSWSTDGFISWTEIDRQGGDSSYSNQSFVLAPSAGNSSTFELRFETNNDLTSERAEIDNIEVTGI